MCPKFGTLLKVRTFTCQVKFLIYARENNFSEIVNRLLVLKLFQLSNGDFKFFLNMPTAATNSVRNPKYGKFGLATL